MKHTCTNCHTSYEVSNTDLAFYDKVSPIVSGKKYSIPAPEKCPECRVQRRMAWRNERTLYNRKCNLCQKEIISIYHPRAEYTVYCPDCFNSDRWDPLAYGQEYDFSKSFFVQFKELMKKVPVFSLFQQRANENCQYTNLTSDNKNCYLIFAAASNEYAFYTTYIQRCKDISDCFFIFDSELCYECIDCYNCYNLTYSQSCQHCSDSRLLYNCKSCQHCFGCVNLSNKEYCIFNQQYSPEEYEQKVNAFMSSRESFEQAKSELEKLKLALPHKYYSGYNNENFTGDHIFQSKSAFDCFDCNNIEDCKWCTWMTKSKSCYDCYAWGNTGELGYENHLCGNNYYNVQFSDSCGNNISNILYSWCVTNNCHNLFGCISLQRKEYCILNKQYSKEEYENLLAKIFTHMQSTREWGQAFSLSLSPFAYNESIAQEYVPLTREEVVALGSRWKEEEISTHFQGQVPSIVYDINQVNDSILKAILTCASCEKNYRLVAQELTLYRKLQVPVPLHCFACRYKNRFKQRNPRKLWKRACGLCKTPVHTTYNPNRPETVLCEGCYLNQF